MIGEIRSEDKEGFKKVKFVGYVGALQGNKVFIDLGADGMITLSLAKNTEKAWGMYCKKYKITFEEVKES